MSNTHKAFIVAETHVLYDGMKAALEYIGAPEWLDVQKQEVTDSELLVEFMGRLCYKSFKPGLNPNVTKVREGNDTYLGNILKQRHGSVVEHATTTFALLNVSRIFTHELVRHRAGTAYSQESQRFVRLDDFQLYIPDLTEALWELVPNEPRRIIATGADGSKLADAVPISQEEWVQSKQDGFIQMADRIKKVVIEEVGNYVKELGIDKAGVSFHVKKQITSALRRLIPGGVNTNIGITANHRTWRHLIASRTAPGAEDEMIEVFRDIAEQLATRYRNLYPDMVWDPNNKLGPVTFVHEKI